MEGHLCRCGVYLRIVRAVQRAAALRVLWTARGVPSDAGSRTPGRAHLALTRPGPWAVADWLQIGADGRVTVYSGKVEVGQNVRTSLAQAVADELRLPLEAVRLVLADTGRTPFDAGTFGSRVHAGHGPLLRKAATAREASGRPGGRALGGQPDCPATSPTGGWCTRRRGSPWASGS